MGGEVIVWIRKKLKSPLIFFLSHQFYLWNNWTNTTTNTLYIAIPHTPQTLCISNQIICTSPLSPTTPCCFYTSYIISIEKIKSQCIIWAELYNFWLPPSHTPTNKFVLCGWWKSPIDSSTPLHFYNFNRFKIIFVFGKFFLI